VRPQAGPAGARWSVGYSGTRRVSGSPRADCFAYDTVVVVWPEPLAESHWVQLRLKSA